MSDFVVSLMLSLGVGAWLYTKLYRKVGSDNNKQAVIIALILTAILFMVLFLTGHYVIGGN